MISNLFRASYSKLIILAAFFLITAGYSRYVETDSGNILIHRIDVESYEGFPYGGKLFRPISANSMDQRPGILIIPDKLASRDSYDVPAMELARRGLVVLVMEDFSQGTTKGMPDYETENLADAGFTFLNTRTFTDHSRIGVMAFGTGTEKVFEAKYMSGLTTRAFISPVFTKAHPFESRDRIFLSSGDQLPEFYKRNASEAPYIHAISAIPIFLSVSNEFLSEMMEQVYQDMIKTDETFFFKGGFRSSLLLFLTRGLLWILLIMICMGLHVILHENQRYIIDMILPAAIFVLTVFFMNHFLVAVRIGLPQCYLPGAQQFFRQFSLIRFVITILASFILSRHFKSVLLFDILTVCLVIATLVIYSTGTDGCNGILCIYLAIASIAGSVFMRVPYGADGFQPKIPIPRAALFGAFLYFSFNNVLIHIGS